MTLSDRFENSLNGKSKASVAKLVGVKPQNLSNWVSRNSIPAEHLFNVAKVLGISAEWLETGREDLSPSVIHNNVIPMTDKRGNLMQMRYLPVVSWVQAGAWGEAVDSYEPHDADKWIAIVGNVGANAFALKIEGDSMEQEFRAGEYVAVDPAREVKNGSFVIAKLKNTNEATFKQFFVDAGRTYLKPLNAAYPIMDVTDIEDFHICGVVIQKVMQYE